MYRTHSVAIVASFLLAGAFTLYFFPFVQVRESSMNPTLAEGNLIVLSRLAYKFQEIQSSDIVVFREESDSVIKRCVLAPGMTLKWRDKSLYIPYLNRYLQVQTHVYRELQQYRQVPEGFIFVLGDNTEHSIDSRNYGLVPVQNIRGKAIWGL